MSGYLQRLLDRAAPVAAGAPDMAGAPGLASPWVASLSPIATADQRLNDPALGAAIGAAFGAPRLGGAHGGDDAVEPTTHAEWPRAVRDGRWPRVGDRTAEGASRDAPAPDAAPPPPRTERNAASPARAMAPRPGSPPPRETAPAGAPDSGREGGREADGAAAREAAARTAGRPVLPERAAAPNDGDLGAPGRGAREAARHAPLHPASPPAGPRLREPIADRAPRTTGRTEAPREPVGEAAEPARPDRQARARATATADAGAAPRVAEPPLPPPPPALAPPAPPPSRVEPPAPAAEVPSRADERPRREDAPALPQRRPHTAAEASVIGALPHRLRTRMLFGMRRR